MLTNQPSYDSAFIYPLMSSFFWAGLAIATKLLLNDGFDPIFISSIRFLIGSLVLFGFMFLFKCQKITLSIRNILLLSSLGFLSVFLYSLLFFIGFSLSTIVHAVAFMAMIPISTLVVARLLLKEKLTLQRILGVMFGFVGVLFILLDSQNETDQVTNIYAVFWGDMLILSAAFIFGLYSVLCRMTLSNFPALATSVYVNLFGTMMIVPFAFFITDFGMECSKINMSSLLSFLYMGVCGTAIAFFCWYQGLLKLGATRTAIFLNLVPVWGVSFSVIFLDEVPRFYAILGTLLIIFGVVCVQSNFRINLKSEIHFLYKILRQYGLSRK